MVALKKYEPKLSQILANLFNIYLRKFCFLDISKVSPVISVFKTVWGEAYNYKLLLSCPVGLRSEVSKVFEKFVSNGLVDHLDKCSVLIVFQYGIRSSRSTTDILTDVSNISDRVFNRSGATRDVPLNISKPFGRVWHTVLILKSYGIYRHAFAVILSFLSNGCLRVVLKGKFLQEYPANPGAPRSSILGPTISLLYISDLPYDVICNISIRVIWHRICSNN